MASTLGFLILREGDSGDLPAGSETYKVCLEGKSAESDACLVSPDFISYAGTSLRQTV